MTDLGTLGGRSSWAQGINSAGQVAGIANTTYGWFHAALWTGWSPADLAGPGGNGSEAYAINDAGQLAGTVSTGGTSFSHAGFWNGSNWVDLGTLGGRNSYGSGINNLGQVVGGSDIAGDLAQHATLWNGPVATDLGTLGGLTSSAYDINNRGQVVGYAFGIGSSEYRATLWNGTTAVDLNDFLSAEVKAAGWVLGVATSINDNGWITGDAFNRRTGQTHAYLMAVSSVPEPGGTALWLMGLGLMTGFIRLGRPTKVCVRTVGSPRDLGPG